MVRIQKILTNPYYTCTGGGALQDLTVWRCMCLRATSLEATPTFNTGYSQTLAQVLYNVLATSSMARQTVWITAPLQLSVIFFCYDFHLEPAKGKTYKYCVE